MHITEQDISKARELLVNQGPSAVYDFLASKGSRYAILANGVSKEDKFAGITAVSFMKKRYYEGHNADTPNDVFERVKREMASGYINVLELGGFGERPDVDFNNVSKYVNTALPAGNVMGDLSAGDGLTVVHF
jgi:hypothetical protein